MDEGLQIGRRTRLGGRPGRNGQPAGPDERVLLLTLAPTAGDREVRELVDTLRAHGLAAWLYEVGTGVVLLPAASPERVADLVGEHPALGGLIAPDSRYRLVRRDLVPQGSVVSVGGVDFGGETFVVVAGPCAVESRAQMLATAQAAARAGATVLRGGAFKPRTSPYEFQGLGLHGVELLAEARAATGLPFFTEVMDTRHIEPMYGLVDGFQVGARNMQHFELLKALGDVDKPVLLKRNPGTTVEEWLLAAEYLLVGGNAQVILCERGIRTFNTATRFTLDLASVALAKAETHLPVIVDPSHATGDPRLIPAMARAALAAGADGVIVEVHPDPELALSDGFQALRPAELEDMVAQLAALAPAVGRVVGPVLPMSASAPPPAPAPR
jgi:3-deoxy-7-phosphoheptulonate synthase